MILATHAFGLFFLFFCSVRVRDSFCRDSGLEVLGIKLSSCDFYTGGCVDGNIYIYYLYIFVDLNPTANPAFLLDKFSV